MKIGDLVKIEDNADLSNIGIIVDWHVIYDKFGDAVDRFAVVSWNGDIKPEHEYPDMLSVINESR